MRLKPNATKKQNNNRINGDFVALCGCSEVVNISQNQSKKVSEKCKRAKRVYILNLTIPHKSHKKLVKITQKRSKKLWQSSMLTDT